MATNFIRRIEGKDKNEDHQKYQRKERIEQPRKKYI